MLGIDVGRYMHGHAALAAQGRLGSLVLCVSSFIRVCAAKKYCVHVAYSRQYARSQARGTQPHAAPRRLCIFCVFTQVGTHSHSPVFGILGYSWM